MATETKTLGITDEKAMEIAIEIACDRATISPHVGEDGKAILITGCTFDEGRKVAMDIARAIWQQTDQLPDNWAGRHVTDYAGFVAVWLY